MLLKHLSLNTGKDVLDLVDPRTSPWGRYWRSQVSLIPSNCTSQLCAESGRQCQKHQTVEDLWIDVFDSFYDLDTINKVVLGAGEGSGKSHHAGLFVSIRSRYDALMLGRPGLYWIIGEDFEDAYNKEFQYVHEHEEALGNVKHVRTPKGGKDQCTLILNDGTTILTVSAKNPQKIAREQPDGFILAEASRLSDEAWLRVYARAARKQNAWVFGSGSFESNRGPFAERFKEGQGANENRVVSFQMPSWVNRHIYPDGIEDYRIRELRANMSPDRFAERIEGRPSPPRGAVIHNANREIHVNANLQADPYYPVYMFVDPGTLVYCVLFVQLVGNEVRVLDELYLHSPDYTQPIERSQMNPLWRYITATGHVMDFAGRQHHFGNSSAWEAWSQQTSISFNTTPSQVEKDAKAEAILSMMALNPETGRPYVQVHPRCRGLLSEWGLGESPLKDYGISGQWMRRVAGDGTVGEIVSKNDHANSALAYGKIVHYGSVRPGQQSAASKRPLTYLGDRRSASSKKDEYFKSLFPVATVPSEKRSRMPRRPARYI